MTRRAAGPAAAVAALAALALALWAAGAAAGQQAGLLWNRSGLPAVFPLVLMTDPGTDTYLRLRDPASGRAVFAAFATGGETLRVLVPPGRYRVTLDRGRDWRGAARGFGTGAARVTLAAPLRFETRGPGTRAGHLIDLRGGGAPRLRPTYLCQTLRILRDPPLEARPLPERGVPRDEPEPRLRAWRTEVRDRPCG